ncbi:O-antigen ligase family protein [Micrococcus luteus]|nr:O-antigen ligase family protein [Micrococcus luteus]
MSTKRTLDPQLTDSSMRFEGILKWIASACISIFAYITPFAPNLAMKYGPFLALAGWVLSNPIRARFSMLHLLLLCYSLINFASGAWATDQKNYSIALGSALSCSVAFIAVSSVRWSWAQCSFFIMAFLAGIATAFNRFTGSAGDELYISGDRITQAGDLNVNELAYCATAGFILVLIWIHTSFKKTNINLFAAMASLMALSTLTRGILATQTRGAILAVLFATAWFLFTLALRRLNSRLGWIVLGGSLLVSITTFLPWSKAMLTLLDFGNRSLSGLSGRLDLWPIATQEWSNHILFGVGAGGFRQYNGFGLTSHNSFLEIGVTLGLIGFVTIILFMIILYRQSLRISEERASVAFIGYVSVVILVIFSSSVWILSQGFWVFLMLAFSLTRASVQDARYPPLRWPREQ